MTSRNLTELSYEVPLPQGVDIETAIIAGVTPHDLKDTVQDAQHRGAMANIHASSARSSYGYAQQLANMDVEHYAQLVDIQHSAISSYRDMSRRFGAMNDAIATDLRSAGESAQTASDDIIADAIKASEQKILMLQAEKDEKVRKHQEKAIASGRAVLAADEIARKAQPEANLARALDERIYKLGKGGYFRAALLGGVVVASAVNALLIASIAAEKGNSNPVVTPDNSILPGNTLPLIPGTPDIPRYTGHYDVYGDKIVVTTETQPELHTGSASNPLARGNKLTGTERAADIHAVQPLISYLIKNHAKITSVEVTGKASDDPLLGVAENANASIAEARGKIAAEVFAAEAKKDGLVVPQIEPIGYEATLKPDQIAQLSIIAGQQGMNTEQLVTAYNDGTAKLSAADKTVVDKLLASNRGADFVINLDKSVQVKSTEYQKIGIKDFTIAGRPGEIITGAYLFIGGMYSMMFGGERYSRRLAHKRAQRIVKKAEA
ncbi:MAG: hypothetical protein JWO41_692 [Candidatus Saccharibacteria bacterium]|nr:hypothetical protein [Candidatus Saccharibacteria bacterium]